jgi:hypothetical protein
MKIYIASFASKDFAGNLRKLRASAKQFGHTNFLAYSHSDIIHSDWYKQHSRIFEFKRGLGFWLWKPHIILKALESIQEGDILIYIDARSLIINKLEPLIKLANEVSDIVIFENTGYQNSRFTKRDAFHFMECDTELFHKGPHVDASIQIYKKSPKSIAFVGEYLKFCENINIITDLPNICGLPNLPDFEIHAADQSVLSLLALKHKILLYRSPDQYSNYKKAEKYRVPGEFLQEPYINVPLGHSDYPTLIQSKNPQILPIFKKMNLIIKKMRTKLFNIYGKQ